MPLKIALVTETFSPEVNGVAMTLGHVVEGLGRIGHAVTVLRPRQSKTDKAPVSATHHEELFPGFPIPGYPLLRLGFPASSRLHRLWTDSRPDLVHVATEGPLGWSALRTAHRLGIPVTSSFHTNFHAYSRHYGFGLLHRPTLGYLRYFHNRTRRTFTPTQELCDELMVLGFRNLALLSRGVDTALFSPSRRSVALRSSWEVSSDDPVVLHAGRMAAEKNYGLLFRVFEAMRKANPRCCFVLAGDGPLRRKLVQDHPECRFVRFIPRSEMAVHYASADVYIHPSLSETFGNVLTEALASGLAVAGFDYAAARQFIRHNENGLTVPCDQPEALVAAAVRLATDPALVQRLRKAAPAAVSAQSWEAIIRRFAAELEQVVAVPPRATRPAKAFPVDVREASVGWKGRH